MAMGAHLYINNACTSFTQRVAGCEVVPSSSSFAMHILPTVVTFIGAIQPAVVHVILLWHVIRMWIPLVMSIVPDPPPQNQQAQQSEQHGDNRGSGRMPHFSLALLPALLPLVLRSLRR